MKKEKNLIAVILFVLMLYAVHAKAQQDSVRHLDEVVITATRSEQPVIDVPRSVTVVSRADLGSMTHNSVGELLSTYPGIFVVGAMQTPGSNQSLFLRGANSNQFTIMIDGNRITDPSTPGAGIDLNELSLANVERIEIIRGAHSTVYGGSAIGGVINIITSRNSLEGFHGNAYTAVGHLGGKSVSFNQALAMNYGFRSGFYLNGTVFNQYVNGLNATLEKSPKPDYTTRDLDNFRKTDYSVKAGFRSDGWDVGAGYKRVDQLSDIDDGAFNDDDNAYLRFSRDLLDYHAQYKKGKLWSISLNGSWTGSQRYTENDSSVVDAAGAFDGTFSNGKYMGALFTNEAVVRYDADLVDVMFGAGLFHESMRFNSYFFSNAFGFPYESVTDYDSIDTDALSRYAFAQVNFEKKNFGLIAGSRLTKHERFGSNMTFEVSPSWRMNDMLIYGSLSSGFNAPSLYQLFDPTQDYGSFTTRGNASLKPERSLSIEAGIKKEFVNGSYFTLSGFRSVTRDAIEYVYLWDKNTAIDELTYMDYLGDTYLNLARHTVHGVEGTGQINAGKFFAKGNITWLQGRMEYTPSDINALHTGGHHVQSYGNGGFVTSDIGSSQIIRRPQFTGFFETGFSPSSAFRFSASLRHTGSRFDAVYNPDLGPFGALGRIDVKRFNLVDIAASFRVMRSWFLNMRVENVLNESYQEIVGFQTRGRSIYLKVLYQW